jgi:hypothetical protein
LTLAFLIGLYCPLLGFTLSPALLDFPDVQHSLGRLRDPFALVAGELAQRRLGRIHLSRSVRPKGRGYGLDGGEPGLLGLPQGLGLPPRLLLGESLFYDPDQPAGIGLKPVGIQLKGLPVDQLAETGWQLVRMWHPGLSHQDRDDSHLALQRGFNLDAHEIVRVLQAPAAGLVGDREPLGTDQHEQHITGPDGVGDDLGEVIPQLDRVHVLENLVGPEMGD